MPRIACKILLLSCLLLSACATSDEGKPINFSLTAKQNYEKGLAELKEENYQEAARYFATAVRYAQEFRPQESDSKTSEAAFRSALDQMDTPDKIAWRRK